MSVSFENGGDCVQYVQEDYRAEYRWCGDSLFGLCEGENTLYAIPGYVLLQYLGLIPGCWVPSQPPISGVTLSTGTAGNYVPVDDTIT